MKIKHPLLPATLEVLQLLNAAGVDYLLIGAQARELLLYHVYDRPQGRATADIDIVVMVEDWACYETLKGKLLSASDRVHADRVQHRLNYRITPTSPEGSAWQYRIDIIPFGGVENPPGEIQWPPDAEVRMNLAGCQEAWTTALTVEVSEGLLVRCASLPALALLKLMAWADRGAETDRDAEDLLNILKEYFGAGNEDRIYEELPKALPEELGYDPDLMAAALLGQDIRALAKPESLARALDLLSATDHQQRLLRAMLRTTPHTADMTTKLMEALGAGLRAQEHTEKTLGANPAL